MIGKLVKQLREDFERHGGDVRNLSLWAVAVYRYGAWANELPPSPLRWIASKAYAPLFMGVEMATGCTINREAKIGEGFHLIHGGNVRIHPDTVIGKDCAILHDVTIGTNMGKHGVPVIGDGVHIGSGAKILGPITIGDGAIIAANSLVLSDVPAGCTAIGVPARVLPYPGRERVVAGTATVATAPTGATGPKVSTAPTTIAVTTAGAVTTAASASNGATGNGAPAAES
jgi:serine O-acetyltransferase